MTDAPIAIIKKNANEELHISLGEFKGYQLVQQRVFFDAGGGDLRPGKQGLALRLEQLPELISGLQTAETEARRRGLLKGGRPA